MKENPIASAARTKQLLQALALTPNKNLGQNFLISDHVAERIEQAALLDKQSYVIEIGPGLGALSERLAREAAALCLVELDARLHMHLCMLFAAQAHVELINGDALSFDYARHAAQNGWPRYHVVANLPYYITSPLIKHILLNNGNWRSLTLMMQKEVAEKLLNPHGSEGGGPLALLLQYFGQARVAFTVPPDAFLPQPDVHSAVVHVERHAAPPFAVRHAADLLRLFEGAYAQRRKTLLNSLSNSLGQGKEFWQQALQQAGLDAELRAEQVSLHGFGALYQLPQVSEILK